MYNNTRPGLHIYTGRESDYIRPGQELDYYNTASDRGSDYSRPGKKSDYTRPSTASDYTRSSKASDYYNKPSDKEADYYINRSGPESTHKLPHMAERGYNTNLNYSISDRHEGSKLASSNGKTISDYMSEDDTNDKAPRTYRRVATRFAERTSMQGIPYINVSKTWYSKMAWTVIFLAATGGMIFHLFYLFSVYLDWPKQTTVTLGFDQLAFPAITVCNVNPAMKNRIHYASEELQDLVHSVDPGKIIKLYQKFDGPGNGPGNGPPGPSPQQQQNGNQGGGPTQNDDQATSGNQTQNGDQTQNGGQTQNGDQTQNSDQTQNGEKTQNDDQSTEQPNIRQKRFLDKFDVNKSSPRFHIEEHEHFEEGDWERVGVRDDSDQIYNNFVTLFNFEDRPTRIKMGHKMENMLIKCSFAGRSCHPNNFTILTNPNYGNCFTLQSRLFRSRRSGPGQGLEIILFLENHQYLRGLTNGNGAQVLVHEQGVQPLPFDDGLAISSATETYIGLRLVRIERLGTPFGYCNSSNEFREKYGTKYTRTSCQRFCEAKATIERCNCSDRLQEEVNLKLANFIGDIPEKCSTKNESRCSLRIGRQFERGELPCYCKDPCSEIKFEKSVTSRQWPSDDYAALLLQILCDKKGDTECKTFKQTDKRTIAQNFVKINIYFEDLNYQNITEKQDYEFVQFISDVGGTLGLWIGLSVISVVEVLQFFSELLAHLCCFTERARKQRKRPRQNINSVYKPGY